VSEALLDPEIAVASSFSDTPEPVAPGLPGWYAESRVAAWDEFLSLPMPRRTDQTWRFADLKRLDFDSYHDAPEVDEAIAADLLTRSSALAESCGRIVFANDRLIAEPMLDAELAALGVIFKPLSQALLEDAELVRAAFMREPARLGSAKFAALHRARLREGFFLFVPDGVVLPRPVEVFHWLSGDGASIFPHSLIVTGRGAVATVAEYVASAADEGGFCCGVADLVAGEDSQLRYLRTQNLSERARSVQVNSTLAAAGADAKTLLLNLGCDWTRVESLSRMVGEAANSDMLSICVPENDQEMDQRTLQLHESPRTTSNLLYKNALYDQARTVFSGLIKVGAGAHGTDAYQTCRNLLMSEGVEANSMPGLEINADEVKCSHGATSGPIPDEELFYLRARGISETAARQLLTFGFVKEVAARIGDAALEKVVTDMLARRFASIGLG